MAQLILKRAILRGIETRKSEKNGKLYTTATFIEGMNDVQIGCSDFDLSACPLGVLVNFESEVSIRVFSGRTMVSLVGAGPTIKPV